MGSPSSSQWGLIGLETVEGVSWDLSHWPQVETCPSRQSGGRPVARGSQPFGVGWGEVTAFSRRP